MACLTQDGLVQGWARGRPTRETSVYHVEGDKGPAVAPGGSVKGTGRQRGRLPRLSQPLSPWPPPEAAAQVPGSKAWGQGGFPAFRTDGSV